MVAWDSLYGTFDSANGIHAQRFDDDGNTIGGESRVNTYTEGIRVNAAIAALNDGGYVVTWQSSWHNPIFSGEIYAQRFDRNGVAHGSEIRVNPPTALVVSNSAVAGLSDGGYAGGLAFKSVQLRIQRSLRPLDTNGDALSSAVKMNIEEFLPIHCGPERRWLCGRRRRGCRVKWWRRGRHWE